MANESSKTAIIAKERVKEARILSDTFIIDMGSGAGSKGDLEELDQAAHESQTLLVKARNLPTDTGLTGTIGSAGSKGDLEELDHGNS